MPQQKFPVQVTTLPDCDDITRFDIYRKLYEKPADERIDYEGCIEEF
jgi:hypothetical protein